MHLTILPINIGTEMIYNDQFSIFFSKPQQFLHHILRRAAVLHGIGNDGCAFFGFHLIGHHPRAAPADDIIPVIPQCTFLLLNEGRLTCFTHHFIARFPIAGLKGFCPCFCHGTYPFHQCNIRLRRNGVTAPIADQTATSQRQHQRHSHQCHAFLSLLSVHNLHQPFLQRPFAIGETGGQCRLLLQSPFCFL